MQNEPGSARFYPARECGTPEPTNRSGNLELGRDKGLQMIGSSLRARNWLWEVWAALRRFSWRCTDQAMLSQLLPLSPAIISSTPWLRGFAVAMLRRLRGQATGGRFIFPFFETSTTVETGHLLLGVIAVKRDRLFRARDAFLGVPNEALVEDALPEAVRALAENDPERAKALLRGGFNAWDRIKRRLSPEHRLWLVRASAYLDFEEGVALFAEGLDAKLKLKADIIKRLFAAQKRAARKLGVDADYPSVRKAMHGIDGEKRGEKRPKGGASEPIRIGLLNYRGVWAPSTNLGDFIQTIAVVGQLSRFTFNALKAPEAVRDLLAQGCRRDGEAAQSVDGAVELVPVNRDFPLTVAADGPIWLPVCGWFAFHAYNGRFDFPFPGNVRPLFMALHIAKPGFLDEESLAYLRRFEPIGCRDLFTARLLRGAGVQAFFNGCVTMTLDRLRPAHTGARAGRYDTAESRAFIDKGFTQSRHGDPACLVRDFDGNLRAGLALLDRYHTAEEVRTERVHCWLPCRAMGGPVTLKIAGETRGGIDRADPRLDGLAELDEGAFRDVAARFESIARPVLSAVLEGKGEAEVYALWRELCAPAMARTDAMIAERNAKYPIKKVSLDSLGLNRIPVRSFGAERDPESDEVHLLCTFDAKLAEHFPGTLEGVWRHASRPLTVHVFGRGLDAAVFERWSAIFPGVRFTYCDLSDFAFGDVSLLPHTTVSTMDRLLAPELLPDVEKIVYLDVDVLVRKDISRLFDIDLGDALLAARWNIPLSVPDGGPLAAPGGLSPGDKFSAYFYSYPEDRRQAIRNFYFSEGATVFERFGAGILVMSLARMRREQTVEKMLALVRTCGTHDYLALNMTVRDRVKPLTWQWHHIPFIRSGEDPAIVHYPGKTNKPWYTGLPIAALRDSHKEWRENATRARMRA